MRCVLVDVDTQFDFVDPHGALHVPAPGVREAIGRRLAKAEAAGDPIVGSVDSHAWDAWEFSGNGGPFAPHCVKGERGWLRVWPQLPARNRFVPMQCVPPEGIANLIGAHAAGGGARIQSAADLVAEATAGVGIYFEKEVYSMFSNPVAEPFVSALVAAMGGKDVVVFEVVGYCTGGYCVDEAARGLARRGYQVRVLADCTAAIGGAEGASSSEHTLSANGVTWQRR